MARHSKSAVDRAGRFFADQAAIFSQDPDRFDRPGAFDQVIDAIDVVEWWRSEHAKPLSRVAANLRYHVSRVGEPIVAQRLKRVPTIAGKLLREPGMKLSRMADIGGVRAIVPNQAAAYTVAAKLRRNWTIARTRDYVETPKADGYRALHLINRHRGKLIEIQLRTPNQDAWANMVETLSRTAHPGLKFGQGPESLRDLLLDLADILADEDRGLVSAEDTSELTKARAISFVEEGLNDQ